MKNRDEYIASIYAKRDKKIKERKKRISVLASILCLTICFVSVFAFGPKKLLGQKSSPSIDNESTKNIFTQSDTTVEEPETNLTSEIYLFNNSYNPAEQTDGEMKTTQKSDDIKSTKVNLEEVGEDEIQTETALENAAGEKTTKRGFGGFKPLAELIGSEKTEPVIQQEQPGTEPYLESPADGSDDLTVSSTQKPKYETDKIVSEALKHIPDEYTDKIITEKTDVTITHSASGEDYYTVYLYTSDKSFKVKLNSTNLGLIETNEKDNNSGNEGSITPAHPPETTEALPEYIPQ